MARFRCFACGREEESGAPNRFPDGWRVRMPLPPGFEPGSSALACSDACVRETERRLTGMTLPEPKKPVATTFERLISDFVGKVVSVPSVSERLASDHEERKKRRKR